LPDPALTVHGEEVAYTINLGGAVVPDLIIISPMTRAIQTAINAFSGLIMEVPQKVEVQIWPELREAHDAPCNKGVSRAEISRKFPQFDFSSCPKEWDHVPHSTEAAIARAEIVRQRLNTLSETYNNIAVICHRGFLAFLVQGERFALGGKLMLVMRIFLTCYRTSLLLVCR
jgi:broad specificity phosphatase PhoE